MLNRKTSLLILLSLWMQVSLSCGQNIVTIAKKSTIGLDLTDLVNNCLQGKPFVDSSIWINYRTKVSPSEPPLSITAEIVSGQSPEGFQIFIEVRQARGLIAGKYGKPTGRVALSHMPHVILYDIGSSYTGSGINMGHQVFVHFEVDDFSLIEPGETALYLQFTINSN